MVSKAISDNKAMREAMAAFRLGRKCYEAQQFALARRFADLYRNSVDYRAFVHEDRRRENTPEWSVIIVSYGTGKELLGCLDSVFEQEKVDYEVILVDNGNNQALYPELKKYPLLYIAPPQNMLPSEGRNIGSNFARGRYLAFIDDDGLVGENYLQEGQRVLSLPNVIGARGRVVPKTEGGATSVHYDLGSEPKPARLSLEGNMVIHKDVYLDVGGFDPLMFGHEGNELGKRLDKLYDERCKIYWPTLELKHDFAMDERLEAKRKRQQIGKSYISFLASRKNSAETGE